MEFYLSNCKLGIYNESEISIQVKNKEIKFITQNFLRSKYQKFIENGYLWIKPYEIKIADSSNKENYIRYIDILNLEEKKDYVRLRIISTLDEARKNYPINAENKIEIDFCSIQITLESSDNSIEKLKELLEYYEHTK